METPQSRASQNNSDEYPCHLRFTLGQRVPTLEKLKGTTALTHH